MKQIGIKLADGTFYPVLTEGSAETKNLNLTTVQDNQTTVHVDLYRSETGSMDDAEYVDTLEIRQLNPHENGEPTLNLEISLDENNALSAKINDPETGKASETQVTLVSRTLLDRDSQPVNFNIDQAEPLLEEKEQSSSDYDFDIPGQAYDNTIANDLPVVEEDILDETSVTDEELSDFDEAEENEEEITLPLSAEDNFDNSEAFVEENNDFEIPADTLNDLPSMEENTEEESAVIGPSPNDEDFSFDEVNEESSVSVDQAQITKEENTDDFNFDSISESPLSVEETVSEESPAEEVSVVDESFSDEVSVDIPSQDIPSVEESIEETAVESAEENIDGSLEEDAFTADSSLEESADISSDDIDLSDFNDNLSVEEVSDSSSVEEENPLQNTSEDLSSFDTSSLDDFSDSNSIEETSFDTSSLEEENSLQEASEDFNLPDFDESDSQTKIAESLTDEDLFDLPSDSKEVSAEDSVEESSEDDFTLPDMDDLNTENSSVNSASAVGLGGVFDEDFGEPDLNVEDEFDTSSLDDSEYKTKDPTFRPDNNMFSDLYDKETLEGKSTHNSDYEDAEDIKKKTRVPVIICIVCAIICIIGALLVLFVIPSKMNLLSKNKKASEKENKVSVTESVKEEPLAEFDEKVVIEVLPPSQEEAEPEPEVVAPAKENEIVLAKESEVIVPEVPKPAVKKEAVTYKIKWGDTLWDIANAYYKNPWRYKFLARYNGIKNPDRIISGTYIKIPSE